MVRKVVFDGLPKKARNISFLIRVMRRQDNDKDIVCEIVDISDSRERECMKIIVT